MTDERWKNLAESLRTDGHADDVFAKLTHENDSGRVTINIVYPPATSSVYISAGVIAGTAVALLVGGWVFYRQQSIRNSPRKRRFAAYASKPRQEKCNEEEEEVKLIGENDKLKVVVRPTSSDPSKQHDFAVTPIEEISAIPSKVKEKEPEDDGPSLIPEALQNQSLDQSEHQASSHPTTLTDPRVSTTTIQLANPPSLPNAITTTPESIAHVIEQQAQIVHHYERHCPDLPLATRWQLAERTVARMVQRQLDWKRFHWQATMDTHTLQQNERHHQAAMQVQQECHDTVDQLQTVERKLQWSFVWACLGHVGVRTRWPQLEWGDAWNMVCPAAEEASPSWTSLSFYQGVAYSKASLACGANLLTALGVLCVVLVSLYWNTKLSILLLVSMYLISIVRWEVCCYSAVGYALLYGLMYAAFYETYGRTISTQGMATHRQINMIKIHARHITWGVYGLVLVSASISQWEQRYGGSS